MRRLAFKSMMYQLWFFLIFSVCWLLNWFTVLICVCGPGDGDGDEPEDVKKKSSALLFLPRNYLLNRGSKTLTHLEMN